MKKIPSFTVNHEKLVRGIYVSRRDYLPEGGCVTTFDVRMKEPNREPALDSACIHTIEHLAATFLRNDPEWASRIVYWGPMGCLTGNYLLVSGECSPADVAELMRRTFAFIASYDGDIPGATPRDCGNYSYQNLPLARAEAARFLHEVLEHLGPENTNYPE